MIALSEECPKNRATSGAKPEMASASAPPIATVHMNVVCARAGSSSALETIRACVRPRSWTVSMNVMNTIASATSPKSDGVSSRARIAVATRTTARPPTYAP